jgi:hypothetical protein
MFVQDGFLYLIVTRHKLTVYSGNKSLVLLPIALKKSYFLKTFLAMSATALKIV